MISQSIIAGIILATVSLASAALAQSGELLDLTKKIDKPWPSNTGGAGGVTGGVIGGQPWPTLPVKITLVNLDKQQYKSGEAFVYEVSLENMSNQPLLVPWEPDKEKLESTAQPNHTGLLQCSLSLVLDELKDYHAASGVEFIYGAPSVPESLKKILPGQKVRIRAPGRWYFTDANVSAQIYSELPRTFMVRARFSLKEGQWKDYEPLLSDSLQLELRK